MALPAIGILGGSGRIGRAVASRLSSKGHPLVLVGRNGADLTRIASQLSGCVKFKVGRSTCEIAEMITQARPAVVLNTMGPFARTAVQIARACPPGTHYVDLSNEYPSVRSLLELHEYAREKGSIFVTGAGFGVFATEAVVLRLCQGRPPAKSVRSAAIPAVESEPGPVGEAFAASIMEGLAFGGRHYEDGQLVRSPLLSHYERLTLPDGRSVGTASSPTGELEATKRASGAPFAVSSTSMVPRSAVLRFILPGLLTVLRLGPIRRFLVRRIARVEVSAKAYEDPKISWTYAKVVWSPDDMREGWMRTGDAMVFTAEVMAQVAVRISAGGIVPGAYTPGALFGANLVGECGGEILI